MLYTLFKLMPIIGLFQDNRTYFTSLKIKPREISETLHHLGYVS